MPYNLNNPTQEFKEMIRLKKKVWEKVWMNLWQIELHLKKGFTLSEISQGKWFNWKFFFGDFQYVIDEKRKRWTREVLF